VAAYFLSLFSIQDQSGKKLAKTYVQPKFTTTSETSSQYQDHKVNKEELRSMNSYDQGLRMRGQSYNNTFYHGLDASNDGGKLAYAPETNKDAIEKEIRDIFGSGGKGTASRFQTSKQAEQFEQKRRGF